jgi:predicted MFS family arabinose efflux permease
VGVALFGVGFGATQKATLTLMYVRVPESGYGAVSALVDVAYDSGMAVGTMGFGVLAARTGYPWAFTRITALMLNALARAWRDRQADVSRR